METRTHTDGQETRTHTDGHGHARTNTDEEVSESESKNNGGDAAGRSDVDKLKKMLAEMDGLRAKGEDLTEEELVRMEALAGEIEAERRKVDLLNRTAALSAELRAGVGRLAPEGGGDQRAASRPAIEVGDTPKQPPQFRNLGEFVDAMVRKDERFQQYVRDYDPVKTGDTGVSYLIPATLSEALLSMDPLEEIMAPRCVTIPAGSQPDAAFKMPVMKQGTGGVFNGVTFAWSTEGAVSNPVENPTREVVTLTPHEVIGTWNVTGQVLRNVAAYGAWIEDTFQRAFRAMRDKYLITGEGTTEPIGILNSDCAVAVTRAGAGTLSYVDALKLRQVIPPAMRRSAIWIAASDAMVQIEGMKDAENRLIYGAGDISQARPETLYGLPLFYGDHAALGEAGDLSLVVPQAYYHKAGFGPALAISEHAAFTSGNVVFRLVASFDGAAGVQDPLTLENGHIVSPVATLTGT